MKALRSFVVLVVAVFVASLANAADAKFVGSAKCKMCHVAGAGGTAYKVWEKSAHAGAYKTLLGEPAKKIAKEKGLKVAANEAPECLKCHVTGGGTAKNVDKSFKMEEGVGCEACHGAASGFVMIHSKKDEASKKKAMDAGMTKPDKSEKFCTTCHNSESPTFKGFKFDEAWAKIEHGKKK
jgi:hypothetical protein